MSAEMDCSVHRCTVCARPAPWDTVVHHAGGTGATGRCVVHGFGPVACRTVDADTPVPPCGCGSIGLYAEDPPRFGPHHQVACSRYVDRVPGGVA